MDFNALRLKYHGDAARLEEILQAECRSKCARKLERTLRCEQFLFPSTALAEMATAEPIAEYHARLVEPGTTVLDMTLGLGIDAFAMARAGARVTGIDIDPKAAQVALHNAQVLGVDVEVVCADSVEWLRNADRHFDVIFIDPARRDGAGRHFALSDCRPDVTKILPLLLKHADKVLIKCSPMLDISEIRAQLNDEDADVTAVGVPRECKELLVELPGVGSTSAITVDKQGNGLAIVSDTKAVPSPAAAGAYLLEPYPAVMKAGLKWVLDEEFGMCKFAPSTHLYCSATVPDGFPGDAFEILEVHDFNKRTMADVARRYGRLNVTTRNFPLSAPELVKKMKIKEGGDYRMFALTAADNRKLLIITLNEPITALSPVDDVSASTC